MLTGPSSALQALVVVVGNPAVLAIDPNWAAMLAYMKQHNACVGCPMPTDDALNAALSKQAVPVGANNVDSVADQILLPDHQALLTVWQT